MKNLIRLITAAMVLTMTNAFAENIGVYGTVYPIAEPDMTQFIKQTLNTMKQDGRLAKMESKFKDNVAKHLIRPNPVSGITTTSTPKTFYYDPTFILPKAVKDVQGNVIVPAGTKVNPLARVKLNEALIFIDADDANQIRFAKAASTYYQKKINAFYSVKIILVKGDTSKAPVALKEDPRNKAEKAVRIYFDQYGYMSHKLGIKHVPALVTQDGLQLKIEEFADDGKFQDANKNQPKHQSGVQS